MIKKIFFILIVLTAVLSAQTVFEPINSSVYEFLDRMAQKGNVVFNDEIKPVTRKYIAQNLYELSEKRNLLNPLETEELNFYLKDYGIELKYLDNNNQQNSEVKEGKDLITQDSTQSISGGLKSNTEQEKTTIFGKDPYGRFRAFAFEDNLFKIEADPILGYQLGSRGGSKYSHRWNGINIYGYLSNNIGFSFRFQDNSEDGTTLDKTKNFSPATGVIIAKSDLNNIQYSEVDASIAANWSWGEISINKDYLNWGYGQSGLLVLSDKAPSFPFIRLDIHPISWMRFNYFHAWLSSDIIDTTSVYRTLISTKNSAAFRNKFLASHTLTVIPHEGIEISIGESIIYSDKLEISYLIPIMFFRLADHYLSQANNNVGGNSQFFFGVSSRNNLPNTHLYGTLFVDEVTLEGLFNSSKQRNQFGFTLGGSITDLPLRNLTLTTEFTKIFPFVYSHFEPILTYQSSNYIMGHWMGNNADLIYGALNYRFIRGLQATIWGQYIRKGEGGTADEQYSSLQPPFLFGLRTNYSYFGFDLRYEITHKLFAKIQYQTTKTSSQQVNLSYSDNKLNEFYLSLYYGI